MYPQYGDGRYAQEITPGQGQMMMDPTASQGRFSYAPYYGPKAPEGVQIQGVGMSSRGHQFSAKSASMMATDSGYGQSWGPAGLPYVGPSNKAPMGGKQDYGPYPGQVDVYGRPSQSGYLDWGPAPPYGAAQYPGQYSYGMPKGMHPSAAGLSSNMGGMMMEGYSAGVQMTGGMPPYSSGGSWNSRVPPLPGAVPQGIGRTWPQDPSNEGGGSPTWTSPTGVGLPPVTAQQQQTSSQHTPSYRQQLSQPSMGAASPQTPYPGELQKPSSISSLRDVLMTSSSSPAPHLSPSNPYGGSQVQAQSHLYPGSRLMETMNNPSPIAPSMHRPHTPDASTPTGTSSVMSPSLKQPGFFDRQDTHHVEPELRKSYSKSSIPDTRVQQEILGGGNFATVRNTPYQVENMLADRREKANGSDGSLSSPVSGQVTPFGEQLSFGVGGEKEAYGNVDYTSQGRYVSPSPKGVSDGIVPEGRAQLLSPVERSHPSIMQQYNFSDDPQRKDFLDNLLAFLEKKEIPLISPPMFGKSYLDLYRVYGCVEQMGGFPKVTEKFQWEDVVRTLYPGLSNPSQAQKSLQLFYIKLLLPYECHMRGLDQASCMQSIRSAMHCYVSKSQQDGGYLKVMPTGEFSDQPNGDISDQVLEVHRRLSQRTNSQDSDMSGYHGDEELTHTISHNPARTILQPPQVNKQKLDAFEFGEGASQDSMDNEPLPDISVQEAESLLGMSSLQFLPPSGGAGTPGGQNTPSPSYTPQYQSSARDWSNADIVPNTDVSELGILPGHPPPAYPPAYPMDTMYRVPSHPSMMMSGYPPYGMPSSQVVPNDYIMMRGSYPNYPSMVPLGPSGMDPGPYSSHYPMAQQQHMAMYRHGMEMGYLGHGGGATPGDWQQQQWRHSSRMSSIPPHMQMQFLRTSQPSASTSPRLHQFQSQASSPMAPSAAVPSVQQQSQQQQLRSSPHPPEVSRLHWQDQASIIKVPSAKSSGSSSPKASQKLEPSPGSKSTGPTKIADVPSLAVDSMRRPLPDWNGCVEGTKPQLAKRRRLFSGDCGHVEPWRLMMSLKSGVLAESTWALDTLNILLHDDRTVGFFYLKHHHSLLNTLVDHFKLCLSAIFGEHFESLGKYYSHCEGEDVLWPQNQEEHADGHNIAPEWVLGASLSDHSILSKKSGWSASRKNAKNKTTANCTAAKELELEQAVPLACVFNGMTDPSLGRSDTLSHIEVSFSKDDPLFFSCDPGDNPPVKSRDPNTRVERSIKQQRIDETPVADLLRRSKFYNHNLLLCYGRRTTVQSPKMATNPDDVDRLKEDRIPAAGEKGELHPTTSDVPAVECSQVGSGKANWNSGQSVLVDELNFLHTVMEESEIYQKELMPLWTVSPNKEFVQARCLCVSNILRSLSFVPGNDLEFSQHAGILVILGRLLMLHHDHLIRPITRSPEEKSMHEEKVEDAVPFRNHWWWDCLEVLQENALVMLSNISGQLDLSLFPESICYPLVDGLLHWLVCPSARSVDPLPDFSMVTSLSPQKLVLETLAKMSILDSNVNFILATPPLTRLDLIFSHLVQWFGQKKLPVVRQFALVFLANLAQGDEMLGQMISEQKMTVSLLLECLEVAEQACCTSGGQLPGGYNPDDPNSLSIAMLRRAAMLLHCLAKLPQNRTTFLPFRDRLLYLSTSEYVEPSVSSVLMDVLFELGKL